MYADCYLCKPGLVNVHLSDIQNGCYCMVGTQFSSQSVQATLSAAQSVSELLFAVQSSIISCPFDPLDAQCSFQLSALCVCVCICLCMHVCMSIRSLVKADCMQVWMLLLLALFFFSSTIICYL